MSDNLVTFTVRLEKSLFKLSIEATSDVDEFTEKLKYKLNLEDKDEIVILYPTPGGKMKSLKTEFDIGYLKETKLCYNAISKQIYCSVELVVIIIHGLQQDDPRTQIMGLTKKVDQLSSKLDEYLLCFDNKLKETTSNILECIRSITLSEQPMENSGNASNKNSIGSQNKPNATVSKGHMKPPKKVKKDKKKIPVRSNGTPATNDDLPYSFVNNCQQNIPENSNNTTNNPQDINVLLKKLVVEGFYDIFQNILVLQKFDNDVEKALKYLKSKST